MSPILMGDTTERIIVYLSLCLSSISTPLPPPHLSHSLTVTVCVSYPWVPVTRPVAWPSPWWTLCRPMIMLAYSNPVCRLGMQRFAWTPITTQPVSHDNVISSSIPAVTRQTTATTGRTISTISTINTINSINTINTIILGHNKHRNDFSKSIFSN